MEVPVAEKILKKVRVGNISEKHGVNLMDPIEIDDYYHWLRDDKRKDKKVLKYLEDENKYTEHIMENTKIFQDNMYKELKSHIKEDYESYPHPHGDGDWDTKYYYYTQTVKDKSYPIHCRLNMETKEKEILLDVNELAKGKDTYDLSGFEVTKDHKIMSYGVDETGNEIYKLEIIDIESKKKLDHNIPDLMYCSYFWHKDRIYYSKSNETNRLYQVWEYNFVEKTNRLLLQSDEETVDVGISMSNDETYFFINASSTNSSEIYYFKDGDTDIKLFSKKVEGLKYNVTYHDSKFLILTNKDNCRNFKVMITDINNTENKYWKDFISYDESKYTYGIYELKDYLILLYKESGNRFIKVINYKDEYDICNGHLIKIDGDIKNISLYGLGIYNTNRIWYYHESMEIPPTLYEYDLDTREKKLLREKKIPNYDKSLYESKRIYAISYDGEKIPISILYKKSAIKMDGSNNVYLYGYGSYGITVDPDFSTKMLPLIDRGFIYAIAHVRGSSFLGYKWYEDGKLEKKTNTFLDFIACAENLIKNKYTSKGKITIEGRSAGGLLVGAAMVIKPELFNTVIAGVPFVDVINTISDPTMPLSTQEWEEWGNPNQEKFFNIIKKYSPYDNIRENEYPNTLVLAGLNDPRVAYWEPAKFTAKLREYNRGKNIILLKTEMNQGHFGGHDRYKYLKELAFQYVFVLKMNNIIYKNKYNKYVSKYLESKNNKSFMEFHSL